MAALVKHEPVFRNLYCAFKVTNVVKYSALPPKKKPPKRKPGPMIYHNQQKLESRGYLRPLKAYSPPENVEEQFQSILSTHSNNLSLESDLQEPHLRFKILDACFQTFQHGIPNSQLHTINNIGDILEFYKTPVDDLTPIQHLNTKDLPPNLHIQLEPKRFNPDDDTMFDGISAFPQSGTIVSGLNARKKYKSTEPQNWVKDWREQALGYTKW